MLPMTFRTQMMSLSGIPLSWMFDDVMSLLFRIYKLARVVWLTHIYSPWKVVVPGRLEHGNLVVGNNIPGI
jgi:hypothetical protein